MLISFVIPVYNVEKYLNKCLDSIFDSSVSEEEYEVIAIDDGSTDGSPEILQTYMHHKNFRIITQNNEGVSVARNSGIKAVIGKYIYFIDSDDYLLPNAMRTLLGFAREVDCDIVDFDYEMVDDKGRALPEIRPQRHRTPNRGRGKDLFVAWHKQDTFLEVVWTRLYRKGFVVNNSLLFAPGITNLEDTDWQYRCFFLAEKVVYHPAVIYCYRRRAGSLSVGTDKLRWFRNRMKILDAMVSFRNTIDASPDNDGYLAIQGDFIARHLDYMINALYKSPDLQSQRDQLFLELEKRRYMLGFAASKKGRRMYKLTRWLPTKIAFRMYKFF